MDPSALHPPIRTLWSALFLACFLGACGDSEPAPVDIPAVPAASLDPLVSDAIEKAREAVRAEPTSGAAWGRLGMTLDAHDLLPVAVRCYREARRLDASNPRWPVFEAMAQPDAPLADLEALYRESLAIDGSHRPTQLRLVDLLLGQDRFAEALELVEPILDADQNDAHARLARARIAIAADEMAEARKHLMRARRVAPRHREVHVALARVYRALGQDEPARNAARVASELTGTTYITDPWRNEIAALATGWERVRQLARGEIAENRMDRAEKLLLILVKRVPERAGELAAERGLVALSKGNKEVALMHFRAALEREPGNRHALLPAVQTLLGQGENQTAMDLMVAAGPGRATIKGLPIWEGRALYELGRLPEAREVLAAAHKAELLGPRGRLEYVRVLLEVEGAAVEEGRLARTLLDSMPAPSGLDEARWLDLQSKAFALESKFAEAIDAARKGAILARSLGAEELARTLDERVAGYLRGER